MGWRQSSMDFLGDALRAVAGVCLTIDAILAAVFSVWFVAESLWHLHAWLGRTIFSAPW